MLGCATLSPAGGHPMGGRARGHTDVISSFERGRGPSMCHSAGNEKDEEAAHSPEGVSHAGGLGELLELLGHRVDEGDGEALRRKHTAGASPG